MIKKKYFLNVMFIFFISSIYSCSLFSKKVESWANPKNINPAPENINKRNLYCEDESKIQLLIKDAPSLKDYRPLIKTLFESKNFSFIQKAAILSLLEMNRRPDEATPTNRLQYFLRFNKQDYYFDFKPKDFKPKDLQPNSSSLLIMPYLKGIEVLLKTFDKSKSLNKLSQTIDPYFPANLNVSAGLEDFLNNNKSQIIKNEFLTEIFLKGDEVLTKYESFKKINLSNIINLFYKDNNASDDYYDSLKNPLAKLETTDASLNLQCNFDINRSEFSKEENLPQNQNSSHYFGIKEENNFFLAVSSGTPIKPLANIPTTYFIKTNALSTPLPICNFKTPNLDILLLSSMGKGPEQHLKHLFTYDIHQANSLSAAEELLKFSRHLFLKNPDRILYESKRGRKTQIDFFLNMNFPIYHVESLGDIIGFLEFKNKKTFIADDRSKALTWCSREK